ncbi:MAG TPA: hypothetical protein VK957_23210 [Lunatimonas sp.]|nr:hypothetical protein [Lunatimonas sp.]
MSKPSILFAPITITSQNSVQTLYRGEFEITLGDLQIDYEGDLDDLVLTVLPGVDYEIVNGTTIVPSINYANNWPAAGEILPVDIQLSDGTDQSEVYPFKILVIPPNRSGILRHEKRSARPPSLWGPD